MAQKLTPEQKKAIHDKVLAEAKAKNPKAVIKVTVADTVGSDGKVKTNTVITTETVMPPGFKPKGKN